jgi:hypothetical protein
MCQRVRQHFALFFSQSFSSDKPKFARLVKRPDSWVANPILGHIREAEVSHWYVVEVSSAAMSRYII